MSYAGPPGPWGYRDEADRVSDILSRLDTERIMGSGSDQLKEDICAALGNYLYLLKYGLGVTKEQAMEALFTTGLNDLVTRIVWNHGTDQQRAAPAIPQGRKILTLKAARVNAGLSQADVEAELGFSRSTFTRWERGVCFPRANSLRRLCQLYGVKETDIVLKKDKQGAATPRSSG